MEGMQEGQKEGVAQAVPHFPFEEIEIRAVRTARESETLILNYLAGGGTGDMLLAQLNASKSPVIAALLFHDNHLPILRQIADFSRCIKPAVYCAAANGSPRLLQLLLERGADPYLYMDSTPPFVAAAQAGHDAIACTDVLLRARVDVDGARRDSGMTALMKAAGDGRVDMVRHLLASGADVARRDSRGRAALHWALGYGSQAGNMNSRSQPDECVEVARVLLQAGASPNDRDYDRNAPIHFLACARLGMEASASGAALDLLLRHGADIEARNVEDATSLHLAAFNSDRGAFMIPLLHAAGANLAATARGKTVDELASADGPARALRSIRMGQSLSAAMPDDGVPQQSGKVKASGGMTL